MLKRFILTSASLAVVACTVTAQPVPAVITPPVANDAGTQPIPDGGSTCAAATAYDGAAFDTNTVTEVQLRARLDDLITLMEDTEAGTKTATAAELRALFDAGTPSLRSLTAPGFATEVDALIDDFAAATGKTYTPSMTVPATGGKYGDAFFTARGMHIRETVEKGLLSALFYRRGSELLKTPTLASLDQALALFGAHASFPADDKDPTHPDVMAAKYAERRDLKDASKPGPYLKFKSAAIRAQAALKAGDACKSELTAAIDELRLAWEVALAGTFVYYVSAGGPALDASDATKWPEAFAESCEGASIPYGFRFIPASERKMQDATLTELLALLKVPTASTATAYEFALGNGIASAEFGKAISKVISTYGFTAVDIETFKTNH